VAYKAYVEARTDSGRRAYKQVLVGLVEKERFAPAFPEQLKSHEVSVKQVDQEAGKVKTITYESPVATDAEDNDIEMVFTGIDKLPFIVMESINENTQFKLTIDESKITADHAGAHSIVVDLKDDLSWKSNKYFFNIDVKYEASAEELKK
jgi:hypothetical protein